MRAHLLSLNPSLFYLHCQHPSQRYSQENVGKYCRANSLTPSRTHTNTATHPHTHIPTPTPSYQHTKKQTSNIEAHASEVSSTETHFFHFCLTIEKSFLCSSETHRSFSVPFFDEKASQPGSWVLTNAVLGPMLFYLASVLCFSDN